MKIAITKIVEFDIDEERERINRVFMKGTTLHSNLIEICDLFEQGKFIMINDIIKYLGYDDDAQCKEIEFVNDEMLEIIYSKGAVKII